MNNFTPSDKQNLLAMFGARQESAPAPLVQRQEQEHTAWYLAHDLSYKPSKRESAPPQQPYAPSRFRTPSHELMYLTSIRPTTNRQVTDTIRALQGRKRR